MRQIKVKQSKREEGVFSILCCHGAASPHLPPTPDSTQVVPAFQKSKHQPTGVGFRRSFVKQCFISDFLSRWARQMSNSLGQRWEGRGSRESSRGQRGNAHRCPGRVCTLGGREPLPASPPAFRVWLAERPQVQHSICHPSRDASQQSWLHQHP